MIYPIVIYGNSVLKKQAEPITKDYPELPTLIEDMFNIEIEESEYRNLNTMSDLINYIESKK